MTNEPRILITGGAGFLARAIYRYAEARGLPYQFTALSRDDAKHTPVMVAHPRVQFVRGDITAPVEWLAGVFAGHDIVIHAAAVKYVDRAESNVIDTIRVNVDGSRNVALAAAMARVPRAVAISTDKAVRPANVYGMTKALMERTWHEMAANARETVFTLCRYGNVVGSTGSVIPMWQKAAVAGETLHVTDPEMTRYWMSATMAVETVLEALEAAPGETVIPVMGSLDMGTVATLCMQYVHAGSEDRKIIMGTRPGEKAHEALWTREESRRSERAFRPADGAGHVGALEFRRVSPPGTREHGSRHWLDGESTSDDARRLHSDELIAMMRDAEGV